MTSYAGGVGETTRYQLDNGQPLAAVGAASSTFYLYGRGVIGTKSDAWSHILLDGAGSMRQLVADDGTVALGVTYTPWGDVLEHYGSENIDFGYLGGMYDANTGLLYMGGGRYYDPATGRFLSRGAGQGNPYVPWAVDPAGAMIAPLGLLGLLLGRKKKRSKWDTILVLLVLGAVVVMSLTACGPKAPAPIPPQPPTGTPSPGSETEDIQSPGTTETPAKTLAIPTDECNGTPTATTTPTPIRKNWLSQKYIITHYATVIENDEFFSRDEPGGVARSGNVPIRDLNTGNIAYQTVPVWRFYIGRQKGGSCDDNCANWHVYLQGSGRLTHPDSLVLSGGKQYVQTDIDNLPPPLNGYQAQASYYFMDKPVGACGSAYPLEKDATMAVPYGTLNVEFFCGEKYYIEGFGDTVFTVNDTGSFVDEDEIPHFDIYAGERTYDEFYNDSNYRSDGKLHGVAKVQ